MSSEWRTLKAPNKFADKPFRLSSSMRGHLEVGRLQCLNYSSSFALRCTASPSADRMQCLAALGMLAEKHPSMKYTALRHANTSLMRCRKASPYPALGCSRKYLIVSLKSRIISSAGSTKLPRALVVYLQLFQPSQVARIKWTPVKVIALSSIFVGQHDESTNADVCPYCHCGRGGRKWMARTC
jgi:hypothetical protein